MTRVDNILANLYRDLPNTVPSHIVVEDWGAQLEWQKGDKYMEVEVPSNDEVRLSLLLQEGSAYIELRLDNDSEFTNIYAAFWMVSFNKNY